MLYYAYFAIKGWEDRALTVATCVAGRNPPTTLLGQLRFKSGQEQAALDKQ